MVSVGHDFHFVYVKCVLYYPDPTNHIQLKVLNIYLHLKGTFLSCGILMENSNVRAVTRDTFVLPNRYVVHTNTSYVWSIPTITSLPRSPPPPDLQGKE